MGETRKPGLLYLIFITILLLLLIGIVFVLENSKSVLENKKNNNVNNVVTNEEVTTTTTSKRIELTNFQTSLKSIVNGFSISGNYKIATNYNGMEFNFNCTNYDSEANVCLSGSGLIKFDDTLLPLYTYNDEIDNYLLRSEDYYLFVTDNNIILAYIKSDKKGTIKIYDKKGEFVREINNYINGYTINSVYYNGLTPKIDNNNLIYYSCNNGNVRIGGINLENMSDLETEENIPGCVCN